MFPKQTDLPISYKIAPSQKVLTIRFNPQTQERYRANAKAREARRSWQRAFGNLIAHASFVI
jgi:hypothetical protein